MGVELRKLSPGAKLVVIYLLLNTTIKKAFVFLNHKTFLQVHCIY